MSSDPDVPLVVTTVGTDHHPFDRLVAWVDAFVTSRSPGTVELFSQHGTAPTPRSGTAEAFVDHPTMMRHLATATAVVCHCGPSTVLESLRFGRVPIVVPRLHRYGEAIDDHQVDFAGFLARRRQIVLVGSERELFAALERALADPATLRVDSASDDFLSPALAVERFAEVARGLRPARRSVLLRKLPRRSCRR